MISFKEQIAADNAAIFINGDEFAELHNLNGVECMAIVQNVSSMEELTTGNGANDTYPGIYGSHMLVNCRADEFPEVPVFGQQFYLDDVPYYVENCANDMGVLSIQLIGNER